MARTLSLLLVLVLAGGGGLVAACGEKPPMKPRQVDRLSERTQLRVAGKTIDTEVALSTDEIAQGLMWRRELPEDRGMLFIFKTSRDRSFYMKNVPITLDICFLDAEGVVINIAADAQPNRTEPRLLSEAPARFVLELAGGWAERHGLGPGDQVVISEELAARGQLL